MNGSELNSAIFLDRDGVIIENRPAYVRQWDDVAFLPGALEALRLLSFTTHKVFLVTNQSVVGRGIISLEQAVEINDQLVSVVEDHGARIDGVYMCPHSPEDRCRCRKPAPGLIRRAVAEHNLALDRSLLIGDAITDLQSGWAAGVANVCLVETGRGREQLGQDQPAEYPGFPVFSDILEATIWFVQLSEFVQGRRSGPRLI